MELWLTGLETVLLLLAIVGVCSLFTNGIEWLGCRLNLSHGVVGSVFAAVGTALPETLVPIIAILGGWWAALHGQPAGLVIGHEVGIGSILGAPFILSTLAMGLAGLATLIFSRLGKRKTQLNINLPLFRRDLLYFLPSYGFAVLLAAVPAFAGLKPVAPFLLMAWYGVYVYRTFRKAHVSDDEVELEPLLFARKQVSPGLLVITLQTLTGLLGIILTAHLFVGRIESLSADMHINPLLLSLLVVPLATELPEKFNSIVWIGKQKDTLALGNLTGSMVFQGSFPSAVGIAFTPWTLSAQGVLSIQLCLASTALLLLSTWLFKRLTWPMLTFSGLFYLGFLVRQFCF